MLHILLRIRFIGKHGINFHIAQEIVNQNIPYHAELLSFLCIKLLLLRLGVVVGVESILHLIPLSCCFSANPRRRFPFFCLIFQTPTAPKVTTSPQSTNSTMLDLSRGASVSATSSVKETKDTTMSSSTPLALFMYPLTFLALLLFVYNNLY